MPYGISARVADVLIPARNKDTPPAGTKLMLLDPRLMIVIAVPMGMGTELLLGMLMLVVSPDDL